MNTQAANTCPRCGKQRVDGKSFFEMAGPSKIKVTMTLCPDEKCQEVVDKQNEDNRILHESHMRVKADSKNSKRVNIKI